MHSGKLYDVILILDLIFNIKNGSGVELSSENRITLYVPKGFAHGFITLEEKLEAFYLVTELFA